MTKESHDLVEEIEFKWKLYFRSQLKVMKKIIGHYDANKILWLTRFGARWLPENIKAPLLKIKKDMATFSENEDYFECKTKLKLDFENGVVKLSTLSTFEDYYNQNDYVAEITKEMFLMLAE